MKYITDNIKIPNKDVIEIIDEVASCYPTKIFSEPKEGSVSNPACYTAAGVRLACKLIKKDIKKKIMEILEEECLWSIIDRMVK